MGGTSRVAPTSPFMSAPLKKPGQATARTRWLAQSAALRLVGNPISENRRALLCASHGLAVDRVLLAADEHTRI